MCANDVLKSYHGRKIVQIESWRIMDLNQYIGSMNAKDCIYQNPKPLKLMLLLMCCNYKICWCVPYISAVGAYGAAGTLPRQGPLERANNKWVTYKDGPGLLVTRQQIVYLVQIYISLKACELLLLIIIFTLRKLASYFTFAPTFTFRKASVLMIF